MAVATPSEQDRKDGGNAVLMLSLYLILLAFFILLNALSNFEEDRAKATMDSVNRAFSGRVQLPDSHSRDSAASGLLPSARDLVREIGSMFKAVVPSARPENSLRALKVRVDVPVKALFRPDQRLMRPDRKVLLDRFAGLLLRDTGGRIGYEITILHGVEDARRGDGNPPRTDPMPGQGLSLEIKRGAQIAAEMGERGVAPEAMTIGLLPGHPEIVRFEVRAFNLPDPADDFEDQEPLP